MPSTQFIKSSDGDIADIIAYLRSLPQKPDAAGSTHLGIEGRAMLATGLIATQAGLVKGSDDGPQKTPTSPYELGRYLTRAHCSVCHGDSLTGKVTEASPDLRISIEHYTPRSFRHFFQTGEGQIGHGTKTMTRMIQTQFKYFTLNEVSAIYTYLKAGSLHT